MFKVKKTFTFVHDCTVVALEIRHPPPVLPIFPFDTPRGINIDVFDICL